MNSRNLFGGLYGLFAIYPEVTHSSRGEWSPAFGPQLRQEPGMRDYSEDITLLWGAFQSVFHQTSRVWDILSVFNAGLVVICGFSFNPTYIFKLVSFLCLFYVLHTPGIFNIDIGVLPWLLPDLTYMAKSSIWTVTQFLF